MVFHSELPKKAYLSAMKSNMSGHLEFGAERFTGFFIGNLFYVTYHSGYEWNRRISNQKNAAMGFVKKAEDGCDVHFLRFKGMLCPMVFLPVLLFLIGIFLMSMLIHNIWSIEAFWFCCGIVLAVMVVCSPISALIESMTDGSIEGRRILLSFLTDPTDPYGSIDYIP